MSTLLLFDDTSPDLIPADAAIIGYYVDGAYADGKAIAAKFPRAQLVGIATNAAHDADVLDDEADDATDAQVYDWLNRQIARKVYRPVIYKSVSGIDQLMLTMNANKFARSSYRLWSAHYGAGQHICGPDSCRLTKTECDWTQWTDTYNGESLDASLLSDEPFGPAAAVKPTGDRAQAQALLGDIVSASAKLAVIIPQLPQ